jgi:hypothetical protein
MSLITRLIQQYRVRVVSGEHVVNGSRTDAHVSHAASEVVVTDRGDKQALATAAFQAGVVIGAFASAVPLYADGGSMPEIPAAPPQWESPGLPPPRLQL